MGFPPTVVCCFVLLIFTVPLTSKLIPKDLSHSCIEEDNTCSSNSIMAEDQSHSGDEPMDQGEGSPGDQDDKMSQDLDKESERKSTDDGDPTSHSDDMSQSVPDSSETEVKKPNDGTNKTKTQDESETVVEKGAANVGDDHSQQQTVSSTEQGQETSEMEEKIEQQGESQNVVSSEGGTGVDVQVTETQAATQTDGQDIVKSKLAPEITTVSESSEEEEDEDGDIPTFPATLKEFGYAFNEDGQLRTIEGGERFQFAVKKNKKYNQAHYEAVGEVITEAVYELLETKGNLQRVKLPVDCKPNEPNSFFFMSKDALTNPDKLMVLIHGSGVVRAGQWARSLIINDCLDSGTQLPYIKRAMEEGYDVMVLNTNQNYVLMDGKKRAIRKNSTPQQHANYVWKHFVKKAKAKRVDIVAHSFGGVVTVELVEEYYADFKKRVHRIAFTDSVHMLSVATRNIQKWIMSHTCNWVSSDTPLDTELESFFEDVRRVSAGTQKHVETSWFSFESVFRFLSSK